jgi:hypothetical protein
VVRQKTGAILSFIGKVFPMSDKIDKVSCTVAAISLTQVGQKGNTTLEELDLFRDQRDDSIPSSMKGVAYNEQNGFRNGGYTPIYKWIHAVEEISVLIAISKRLQRRCSKLSVKSKKP